MDMCGERFSDIRNMAGTFALLLEFSNNKAYERIFAEDPFMQMFLSNICLRPSCYACKFKIYQDLLI